MAINFKPMSIVTGSVIASGSTSIIASPGSSKRICVSSIWLQNGVASASQLILVQSGSTTITNLLAVNQGDGLASIFPEGRELRLTYNDALKLNISTASPVYYTITYFTET